MSAHDKPRLVKWPFLAGDGLLVALAIFVALHKGAPLTHLELGLCSGAILLGAGIGIAPFVLEYRGAVRLIEIETLAGTLRQLKGLEAVAQSVNAATAQWHGIQDLADQTLKAAKEVAQMMTAEAAAFREFLQKAGDAEKATLRLEVEKLTRAQHEWLQVGVMILDHVFALNKAAVRSGKPELIEQIGKFQAACRDIARRVGLVPFEPATGEPFDPARHQLADENEKPPQNAAVSETIAAGYTFQGQFLRPAVVTVKPVEQARKSQDTERRRAQARSGQPEKGQDSTASLV
ncbi:MAG: nucleotide exchange factor GrpE [Verrucomicrobiae bacterium]|nr:nucleotide exchange factor GrpE [Verrucomicrobiae bacterium]MCX7722701.1 nucleotide exchange factor GrpE [Verrucomicrobiae bacterium]MDW7978950.1 nucleotide exchange factor GrpE [Verrucomicrobiales bacterium]